MSRIIAPEKFRVVADGGIGRGSNATAHSMCFFRGALYVGSSCGNVSGATDAPRILRYTGARGAWDCVYESPMVEANARSHVPDRNVISHNKLTPRPERRQKGGRVPRDVGYRSMCVFQGKSDPKPALYVSSISRAGGLLLRSPDGVTFTEICDPGFGNPDVYSFRSLTALNRRLFTAPVGTVTDAYLDRNLAPKSMVYVSEDPAAAGSWREAAETGFGDPRNLGVFTLAAAHGHVYAGTANPERGFQLWRTAALGKPPYRWEPIVIDGAGVFSHNFSVSAMVEFNGALYVGSGITGLGYDPVHDIGPASAELIRVHPDGSWDLIFGRVRFTQDGLKVPLSLLGPGLDDYYNSVVWSLAVHDGVIYLGTHQWEPFRSLELGAEEIVGGYQLWASENGEEWELVIEDGHGNAAELGIRTLASTPLGLFVGTNNHSKLLKTLGRWRNRPELAFPDGFQVLLGK